VLCASVEPVEAEYCAAAEALMMCSNRSVTDKNAMDERGVVVLRMLAPFNHMSAVVGMGGSIIRQVSHDTGASLQVGGPSEDGRGQRVGGGRGSRWELCSENGRSRRAKPSIKENPR
jgi:hypothetical protein